MLLFPIAGVVLTVGQHVADVDFVSIIVHGGDQSNFVAADIKDGEFSDLVCLREHFEQLLKTLKSAFPQNRIPTRPGMIWYPGACRRTRLDAF
jgi:hypothetical protein